MAINYTPDIGNKWAVGLDGRGYLLSTLDQESPFEYRSFATQAVPLRTPRIDTSPEPGEASLGDLWVRSQHDWSGGRGQRVFDGENSDRHMSDVLAGLDPFVNDGKLTPGIAYRPYLPHNAQNWQYFTHDDMVYGVYLTTIRRFNSADWVPEDRTITQAAAYIGSRPYHNIVSDQDFFYYSTSTGIYKIDVTEAFGTWTSTESKVNNLTSVEVLKFGKGRLIACKGNDIHVIDDLTSLTSGSASHYSHMDTSWIWTDAEELGQGIYFSGYNGSESKLYLMSFDTTDASAGLTMGIPREVWRAPGDEKILSIKDYAGSAMLIGTSKGIRNIIVIDRDGNVVVGPLIETVNEDQYGTFDNKPYNIAINGRYAYFPYKRETSLARKEQGMAKMDLSTFAFSVISLEHISWAATGFSICIPPWFIDGQVPMYTSWNSVYSQQTVIPGVGNGNAFYDTGEIRFGSLVEKELRSLTISKDPSSFFTRDEATIASPQAGVVHQTTAAWLTKMSLGSWRPASDIIVALQGTDLDYHWKIQLETDGKLRFSIRDTTDTVTDYVSTETLPDWTLSEVVWIYIEVAASSLRFYYWFSNTDHSYPVYENFTKVGLSVTRTDSGFKNDTTYNAKPIIAGHGFSTYGGKRALFMFDYYRSVYQGTSELTRIYGFRPTTPIDNEGNTWTTSFGVEGPSLIIYAIYDSKAATYIGSAATEVNWTLSFSNTTFKSLRILMQGVPAYNSGIGPTILDWRMTCEPIPTPRYFRYYVPIQLYDNMTTLDGHKISRPGLAHEMLGYLETLFRAGTAFTFEKPSGYLDSYSTGEDVDTSTMVRIEEMEFKSYAPPEGASGFGGIALLVLKEIAT